MKLLLSAVLLISHLFASACCKPAGMSFYPKQKEVGLNSLFIIEGFGHSVTNIKNLKSRKIFLKSDKGELVELLLLEILHGARISQAVFKPKILLDKNTSYTLQYENETAEETQKLKGWISKDRFEKFSWKTTKFAEPALVSKIDIKYIGLHWSRSSAGITSYAKFKVENLPQTNNWIKAELVNLNSNESKQYYLFERDSILKVGYFSCSGAFSFVPNAKYKVRFEFINANASSNHISDWFDFDSPFDGNVFKGIIKDHETGYRISELPLISKSYYYSRDNKRFKFETDKNGYFEIRSKSPAVHVLILNLFEPRTIFLKTNDLNEIMLKGKVLTVFCN